MRIPRIHTDQTLTPGGRAVLLDQQAHYLGNVLRLPAGSSVILFNGDGRDYQGTVSSVAKRRAEIDITAAAEGGRESPLRTILGLGLSRGERMDWAIQKSTELGVSEIVPLFTEHGEVRLKGDRLDKKHQHWRQVAISACEQSGRSVLPLISRPMDLSAWIARVESPCKLILDPNPWGSLSRETGPPPSEAVLLIGPEGGFSDSEVAKARQAGFAGIQLGPRILRTETAPAAALAVLQYLWGDLGG